MTETTVSTRTATPVLLWLVLLVSGVANAAGPLIGFGLPVRMVAGVIAIAAITGLITHHIRRRRT